MPDVAQLQNLLLQTAFLEHTLMKRKGDTHLMSLSNLVTKDGLTMGFLYRLDLIGTKPMKTHYWVQWHSLSKVGHMEGSALSYFELQPP